MSFSYKTLNSNDILLTSYIANKQWEVSNATLSQNGITIYIGENLPIDLVNVFDPINDSQTSNEEYRRLVFQSIKNLYYQNYTSGSLTGQFFNSSSFFNYEQSTLTSGSMLAANRNIPTVTGSTALGVNPTVFNSSLYDISSSLYDQTSFDPDRGSKIAVISIDQNIFGSGLIPKTVIISGSTYNLQDDGEGNLLDTLATSSLYVGNVFYSQGLIVITNPDYLCVFGAPPVTINDYFTYLNTAYATQSLDILSNDFADCGALDPSSVQLMSVSGYSFPNYTLNNGIITITPDQTSIIPGNYKLEYTIGNFEGIRSNTSSINLTITSQSLQIENIISSSVCFGTASILPLTFSINYGVPPYSYSLDQGTTYTGIPGFFDKTVSGSITASLTSSIYVKDYLNTVVTQSVATWYPAITYINDITKLPCTATDTTGRIRVTGITAVSASIDGGAYFSLPKLFTGLSTGSHTLLYKDINNCVTSSVVDLGIYPNLTASVTQSDVYCYGADNGSLIINLTNVTDELVVDLTNPTGGYIYQNVFLSTFPNNQITASNLTTGSYNIDISPFKATECQFYTASFTITSPPTAVTTSPITASYISSCSNAIVINATGGTAPYTYFAFNTGSGVVYSSDTSTINLDGLNSGHYTAFVIDDQGCSSPTSSIAIFGRNYIYSGSSCEISNSVITGYVSSSGIQQVFTSGPYSGSIVTSSYFAGASLLGPTINFSQSFISGTVDIITPCNPSIPTSYYRYYLDTNQCVPPTSCVIPTLLTANPVNCNDQINWTSSYTTTYNSSSNSASYTVIQYSTTNTFTGPSSTKIITNPSSGSLTVNTLADLGINTIPSSVIYFRAYNSCSNGATSSWSNVLTASCTIPPPPPYLNIELKNDSPSTIEYYYSEQGSTPFNLSPGNTTTFSTIDDIYDINFRILNPSGIPNNGLFNYKIIVSGSNDISNQIFTVVQPLKDNPIPAPTVVYQNYTPSTTVNFKADNFNLTDDLLVNIDRTAYPYPSTIKLTIDNA